MTLASGATSSGDGHVTFIGISESNTRGWSLNTKKTQILTRGRWGRSAAVIAMFAAAAAAGADITPAADSAADSGSLQEIVVTAAKRSETLQSVPISVTAFTSAELGQIKMDTPSDLVAQVPNLQVNGIVGEGSPLFSLRGISMFDYSLNQSSPVASYIDEVYKGNFVLFGVEMYDLERIEVLRGPQGTLYGKNTTGGAINFITHKVGFDTEADIKVGGGNYNRREVEGDLQTAVIPDRLAVRFAFTYTKVDGYVQNVLPGHPDLEGVDQYGLRLSFLYKAADNLDFTLRFSKSMQDPQNYAIIDGRIPRRRPPARAASDSPAISERRTAPIRVCRSPTIRSRKTSRRAADRTTRPSS